jgi:hypothetical protein
MVAHIIPAMKEAEVAELQSKACPRQKRLAERAKGKWAGGSGSSGRVPT